MSMFNYGFGAAGADIAYDQANPPGYLEAKANEVKAKTRQMILAFEQTLRDRNSKIDEIKSLPDSVYRDQLIAQFKSVDGGGWFTPSFYTQAQVVSNILQTIGMDSNLPEIKTLGIAPLIALEAVPTAVWVTLVASLSVITAAITYFQTQSLRYEAIKVNPEGVAKADPTLPSLIGTDVGSTIKIAAVILSLGLVATWVMREKK